MSFEKQFKKALNEMIPKTHDDYVELKYSDELFVQVWSHDDGAGAFELYVMVPHNTVDAEIVGRDSGQLPSEVPNVEQLYTDIEQFVEDETGQTPEIVFYLMEVVDDGTWEQDASVYCTHKLTA
jgi:hypothetical protein